MKLGRYEIVRELGKGAMGVVYLGRDPLIGRLVALKTIRIADTVDQDDAREFQQRFIREAQAAGILSHPAIVTVHDIGQDQESALSFIAMEYVEGKNLKELISSDEPITFDQIAEIIAQVAEALDYAHSKGIIHRDVKPANIIICDGGAKITDFGIAKIASTVTNLTSTGQFLGTPNYMAPEQVKGAHVDGRSDIFSLGIVFYEALARKKPFGGDSLTTISYKIVHEPFPALRELDPRIPETYERIVEKALAKDSKQRYQRARDMADDIRRVLAGKQPHAEPVLDGDTLIRANPGSEGTLVEPFPEAGSRADSSLPRLGSTLIQKVAGHELARRRVPPLLFFGILMIILIPLVAVGFSLWKGRSDVPHVDTGREQLVDRQKKLRDEAEALLAAGNTAGAYEKYRELSKIAPNSPAVQEKVRKLEELRFQQLSDQQKVEEAQAKLAEAKTLFDARKYDEAIPLLDEALHLNPNLEEAVMYLRISREALAIRQIQRRQPQGTGGSGAQAPAKVGGNPGGPVENGTAAFRVYFDSKVNDGYIHVKVNNQVNTYENLFEERSGLFRRKAPRTVDHRTEVDAGDVQIDIWIVIGRLGVEEKHTINTHFNSGGSYQLLITFNDDTKKFSYQLT